MSARLRTYVKDSSDENVRRLRTAIRRLNAAYELLPRSIRGDKKTWKVMAKYAKLSKLNAKIRDLDVILSKLAKSQQNPTIDHLITTLRSSRKSQVEPAREMAQSSRGLTVLKVGAKDLSDSKLQKRYDKIVSKLSSKITEGLPIVLEDPERIKELHIMRLDCKQLRYTLELNKTPKTAKVVDVLISWQDVLGSIHDNDVTIEYLQSLRKSAEIQTPLNYESRNRKERYLEFGLIAKKSPPII